MNSLMGGLSLLPGHWTQMEKDVRKKDPEEACGIVIGEGNRAGMVIPITNILHSPTRFRMDPQEELNAFYTAEKSGLEVLAVYHSHPHGPGVPSEIDFKELSFPGIIYLIWYPEMDNWSCKGFIMKSQYDAEEVPVLIDLE